MLTEVAQARVCLADPFARQKYDEKLAAALGLNMATVDLPVASPVHRRPLMLVALAVCTVLILGGAIAAAIFLANRVSGPPQTPDAGHMASKPFPDNQPTGPVSQRELDDLIAQAEAMLQRRQFQQALDMLHGVLPRCDSRATEAVKWEIRKIELAQPTVAGLSMTAATLCDAAKYQEAIDLLSQAVATTTPDPKLELQLQGIRTAKQHHDEIVAQVEPLLKLLTADPTALTADRREQLVKCGRAVRTLLGGGCGCMGLAEEDRHVLGRAREPAGIATGA